MMFRCVPSGSLLRVRPPAPFRSVGIHGRLRAPGRAAAVLTIRTGSFTFAKPTCTFHYSEADANNSRDDVAPTAGSAATDAPVHADDLEQRPLRVRHSTGDTGARSQSASPAWSDAASGNRARRSMHEAEGARLGLRLRYRLLDFDQLGLPMTRS